MEEPPDLIEIILDQLRGDPPRCAPHALAKMVHATYPQFRRTDIQTAIKSLVHKGVLIYSHRFSSTQLERNFQRCSAITPRIALCPARISPDVCRHEVLIRLADGTAFGLGDHPTTRLALKGVEFALDALKAGGRAAGTAALDIGTGSGVLAMAAAKLGIPKVTAVDNDALARHEAEFNVSLNGLAVEIEISAASVETLTSREFGLIMANLRPPTLLGLLPQMARVSSPPAIWVLSGFRPAEQTRLAECLEKSGARKMWQQRANQWGAFVVLLDQRALEGIESSLKKSN